jgi:hypothetical protein
MKAWMWGVFKAIVFAIVGSAVGGGLLLWLEANGVDLKRDVASVLKIAQSPEHLLVALVGLSVLIGFLLLTLGTVVFLFVKKRNRPSLATAKALRAALISVDENVFEVFPDDARATKSLDVLRALLFDLAPYSTISAQVRTILDIADRYLLYAVAGESENELAEASLFDQAKQEICALLGVTKWAIQGPT